jgi:flagellar basal-body rod protein FlgB
MRGLLRLSLSKDRASCPAPGTAAARPAKRCRRPARNRRDRPALHSRTSIRTTAIPISAALTIPSLTAWHGICLARSVAASGNPARDLIDHAFGIHGQALEIRGQRLDLLASNIANAATPGYKARDLDFRAALVGQTAVRYRVPVTSSLDGNTVKLATEQTQFAQNAIQYRKKLGFLSGRIGGFIQALKGE